MAKEYGTAVRPEAHIEDKIEEIAKHLNWSKGAVLDHVVTRMHAQLMQLPRAVRPGDEL